MQSKIYENRKTSGIRITLTNSSNVEGGGYCKINSIEHIRTSRRVYGFSWIKVVNKHVFLE